ncbi:MAG TPA: gliding motility-associated C-terminal domain-containing protein [Bacteroidia bacterium]|nr:gliding motility-associated C-terminal domain-containing protein [Bacteroidia bacterium]
MLDIRMSYYDYTSIYWRTPAGIITNSSRLQVNKSGKYSVEVYSSYFNKILHDSTELLYLSKPWHALRDTFLCGSEELVLNAGNPGCYYLWSNGDTHQKTSILNPGTYWVKISNGLCSVSDTFRVRSVMLNRDLLPDELSLCAGDSKKVLSVKAETGSRVLWNTGAVSNSISISREGWYWVKLSTPPCAPALDSVLVSIKPCECQMLIPNSFTPNEDNRNDYFFPVFECEYTYYTLYISDRWGNAIYSSNDPKGKWDGRFKGNLCPEDIYTYRIESIEKGTDKKQVRTGHISLFR